MKTRKSIMFTLGFSLLTAIIATTAIVTSIELHNNKNNNDSLPISQNINQTNVQSISSNLKPIINYVQKQPINLNVQVTSNSNLKFQWFLNNQPIQNSSNFIGATTSDLTINNPNISLNGQTIYCQVQYNNGTIQNTSSSTFELLQDFNLTKAFILSNVVNDSIPENQSIMLEAKTNINPNYESYLRYQWYLNDKPIQNATNKVFAIQQASEKNTGKYYCKVSLVWNDKTLNTVDTNQQSIGVLPNKDFQLGIGFKSSTAKYFPNSSDPYIFVKSHENFNFFVVPTEDNQFFIPGDGQVTYQWYKDGKKIINTSDLQGGNENILSAENVNYQDSGMYYCVANYKLKDGEILTTQTIPIYLSVNDENHIDICQNINNITISQGQTATFKVQATYNEQFANLNYQWYVLPNNSNEWKKLDNQTSNVLNLSVQQTEEYNGCKFVAHISYDDPVTHKHLEANSNVAEFKVLPVNIDILSQPINANFIPIGNDAQFSVNAIVSNLQYENKLKYQWIQVLDNKKYKILQNQTKPELDINNVDYSQNNAQYVCYVYLDIPGLEKQGQYTNLVKLSVVKPELNPNMTIQGKHNIQVNEEDKLSVQSTSNYVNLPSGYTYQYQWMVSTDNKKFDNLVGENKSTLDLKNLSLPEIYYYKCQIQIIGPNNQVIDTDITPSFSLDIESNIQVHISQMDTMLQPINEPVQLAPSILVQNDSNNLYSHAKFQWQWTSELNSNGQTNWQDINGQNSVNLTFNTSNQLMSGKYFRLVVNIGDKSFYGNPTQVFVLSPIKTVEINNTNLKVDIGSNQTLNVKVVNTENQDVTNQQGYSYQWYVKYKGQSKVINGAESSTLKLKEIQSEWNNAEFYCQVTGANNNVVTSQPAKLTINPISISYQENTKLIDLNKTNDWILEINNVSTNYKVQGASLTYQWQYYDASSKSWINLNDHNINLNLHDLKSLSNNEEFRCIIQYQKGDEVYASIQTDPQKILIQQNNNDSTNNPNDGNNDTNSPNNPGNSNGSQDGTNNPGSSDDSNDTNKDSSGSTSAWIAYPIVFGGLIGIVAAVGLIYWMIQSRKETE